MSSSQNATASFSGYLYQTDVAVWKSLEKIYELLSSEDDINNWELEVEGEEDFTLYKKDGTEIILRESYQVKETAELAPKKYTIPVIKLFEPFRKGKESGERCERRAFLITQKDVNISANIDFLNGLYKENGLIEDRGKLKYLFESDTFLSSKIEKIGTGRGAQYQFKNSASVSTIQAFVQQEMEDFLNPPNFSYECGGTKDEVQINIHDKIKEIRQIKGLSSYIDVEYFFRVLESKVKRFIQDRKNNPSIPNIPLKEIFELVQKNEENILEDNVKDGYLQDMFFNFVIEEFDKQFDEICYDEDGVEGNVELIYNESSSSEEYNEFLDEIRENIYKNIFSNRNKFISFIQYAVGNSTVEEISNASDFKGLKDVFKRITGLENSLDNNIQMFVAYLYAKKYNTNLTCDFYDGASNDIGICCEHFTGVLTGLGRNRKDIKKFLRTNIFYDFEKTHIGIYNEDHDSLHEFLGENKEEKLFLENNPDIMEKHEKRGWNITKTKEIKIFSGKNCSRASACNFMI